MQCVCGSVGLAYRHTIAVGRSGKVPLGADRFAIAIGSLVDTWVAISQVTANVRNRAEGTST